MTVDPLDGGHGAGLAVGQAALAVAPAVPRGHRVGEDAQHLPQELALEREGKPQREGQGLTETPPKRFRSSRRRYVPGTYPESSFDLLTPSHQLATMTASLTVM
jgi:hypothetical protein